MEEKTQTTKGLGFFPCYPMEGCDQGQIQGYQQIAREKSLTPSSLEFFSYSRFWSCPAVPGLFDIPCMTR